MLFASIAAFFLASPAAGSEDALRAEVAPIVDYFYGHDFDRAAPAAAALEAAHPGHPAGPLFSAMVKYQRWVAEGLREDGSWDAVDRDLKRAAEEAKALAKTAPAESHYYLGAALGFRARGLAARKHFIRALPDAAASLKNLKAALALDPTLEDARLGLGMYHYFAARMPAAAKPFARLLVGEPGDRDRGLAELWTVARSTGVARMEARAVLSMILSKPDEADWAGAETLLAELMARYPRNPVYRLRRVFVAERREQWEQAVSLAEPDGKWISAIHPALRLNTRAWALYRAGEAELLQGRRREAERLLSRIDERRAPKGMSEWLRRRRAELKGSVAPSRDVAPFFSGY